jgi:hypothetical protein
MKGMLSVPETQQVQLEISICSYFYCICFLPSPLISSQNKPPPDFFFLDYSNTPPGPASTLGSPSNPYPLSVRVIFRERNE